eukprot:31542-Pelagococcus_subviridis.AAC.2
MASSDSDSDSSIGDALPPPSLVRPRFASTSTPARASPPGAEARFASLSRSRARFRSAAAAAASIASIASISSSLSATGSSSSSSSSSLPPPSDSLADAASSDALGSSADSAFSRRFAAPAPAAARFGRAAGGAFALAAAAVFTTLTDIFGFGFASTSSSSSSERSDSDSPADSSSDSDASSSSVSDSKSSSDSDSSLFRFAFGFGCGFGFGFAAADFFPAPTPAAAAADGFPAPTPTRPVGARTLLCTVDSGARVVSPGARFTAPIPAAGRVIPLSIPPPFGRPAPSLYPPAGGAAAAAATAAAAPGAGVDFFLLASSTIAHPSTCKLNTNDTSSPAARRMMGSGSVHARWWCPHVSSFCSSASSSLLPRALLARHAVVRVRHRRRVQGEELAEVVFGQGRLLERALAVYDVLKRLFRELPLENLLLDRPGREEAVQVALLLLAVAPAPRGSLFVVRGVPVRVEQDESVPADQVDAAPAGFARE